MKFRNIVLVVSLISNAVLFLLAWEKTRTLIFTYFWNRWGMPRDISVDPDFVPVPLSLYRPVSMVVPESTQIPEKPRYPVIEFHGHIQSLDASTLEKKMKETGTEYIVELGLSITTLEEYEEFEKKYRSVLSRIFVFPGLNWRRLKEHNSSAGIRLMAEDLEKIVKNKPVKGIKIWKDFGLYHRKEDGSLWRIDDEAFQPIWDVCEKYNLIVAMHIADPPAFFRPVNPRNERLPELMRRKEWSFYGKDYPSFEELMKQRENLFARQKNIKFVALHFGEYPHDLGTARNILKKYPNVYFDIAQRIDELGRTPRATRNFFIEFQDRILYGTDGVPDYEKLQIYWRFLETGDEYFDYAPPRKPLKGIWKIYGIDLPGEVLKKIYYSNAAKLLGLESKP